MRFLILLLALISMSFLWQRDCGTDERTTREDEIITLDSDRRSGLVFFFNKGVPVNDQSRFLNEVLSVELSDNRGKIFLPGMESRFSINICGFDGYAINFMKHATDAQKLHVKELLESSPIVYKVYRNAIPNEITDICNTR